MRTVLVAFALLSFASAAPARALSADEARHLLMRTGVGPTRAEIEALLPLTRAQAIERVVSSARTTPVTKAPPLDDVPTMAKRGRPHSDDEKRMFKDARIDEAVELKAWWANEMLVTTSPFTEHMVMFWSNHFTSSVQKVKVSSHNKIAGWAAFHFSLRWPASVDLTVSVPCAGEGRRNVGRCGVTRNRAPI